MSSLRIHNSLKPGPPALFVPIEQGRISWYACGPTVYDHAHLGHARNYVSTDIIRRILRDYFGFRVNFVMNVTDVDDKIILKARRQRLLEREKATPHTHAESARVLATAFKQYARQNLPELLKDPEAPGLSPRTFAERSNAAYGRVLSGDALNGDGKPGDVEAKIKMHLNNMASAVRVMEEGKGYVGADEILLPYFDSLYCDTIDARDHTIFTDVTKYWEDRFMEDMDTLNVMRPDIITRVTSYVPQIVKFIDQVMRKGMAYEAKGSVYFDIAAFEAAGNVYARLRPESRHDRVLQEEGEGSESKNLGGKRSPADFAVWKRSKAGEPSWPSPWGDGRPGWHIECSVMASDVLGGRMDIHSGGIDLAFPHHDNELAQSEAYFCQHGHQYTWVNHFMHMGHLSIAGSKMSKSLKNFQTIQDALQRDYTPRGMRVVFLMGRWNDGVEISPDMRQMAEAWETSVNNLFINVKALLVEAVSMPSSTNGDESLSINPSEMRAALEKAQTEVRTALHDSFDTPRAMRSINELIKDSNIYMSNHSTSMNMPDLEAVAKWVTKIVGIFGLDANATPPYDGLGWAKSIAANPLSPLEMLAPYAQIFHKIRGQVEAVSTGLGSQSLDKLLSEDVEGTTALLISQGSQDCEALAIPLLRAISRMRDELRRLAPESSSKRDVLALCDNIRDVELTNLGVYLDDRADGRGALIKFIPRAELLAQQESKATRLREKLAEKEAAKSAKETIDAKRAEKARISPSQMFKDERYSVWDADGLPIKTKNGEDVPKSAFKKMKREWEKQRKAHEDWKANNPS